MDDFGPSSAETWRNKPQPLRRPAAQPSSADTAGRTIAMLTVLDGRHSGASLALAQSEIMIGSGLGCDVVLTDPNVLEHHCRVGLVERFGRLSVVVEANEAQVTANGNKIAAGAEATLAAPVTLQLGEASVEIVRPPRGMRHTVSRMLIFLGLLIGTASAIPLAALLLVPGLTDRFAPDAASRAPAAQTSAAQKSAVPKDTSQKDVDRQASKLGVRLQSAGLGSVLTVERRGGTLLVDGVLDPASYGKWREAKQAYLDIDGAGSMLLDVVKTSTVASPPQGFIASAMFGPAPFVMSASGRRARVGEALEDGWVVERIQVDGVLLKRGNSTVTVRLPTGAKP